MDTTLTIDVSFVIFLIAMVVFVGMFLFTVFGGVGLFAMPLDLIHAYTRKPVLKDAKEIKKIENDLAEKTSELIQMAGRVREQKEKYDQSKGVSGFFSRFRESGKIKTEAKKLRVGFASLKKDFEVYKFEAKIKDSNPLWYILYFVLGCVFFVISILWWLHMYVKLSQ